MALVAVGAVLTAEMNWADASSANRNAMRGIKVNSRVMVNGTKLWAEGTEGPATAGNIRSARATWSTSLVTGRFFQTISGQLTNV